MMTLSELKEQKRELGLTNKDIADMAFMPLSTVEKVFGGSVTSPRRDTLMKLSLAFQESGYVKAETQEQIGSSIVSDVSLKYAAEKEHATYNIGDYWKLNETRRVELIDGEIYYMASPSLTHQRIAGDVYVQLLQNKNECNNDCSVFIAPATVQLDADDKTGLQPDVFVVCDNSKMKEKSVFGAPDLVVEVVSPGYRAYDTSLKSYKYSHARCREYWTVDYERNQIIKRDFTKDSLIEVFTFDDRVPIAISDNKCSVDFAKIKEEIETGVQQPI